MSNDQATVLSYKSIEDLYFFKTLMLKALFSNTLKSVTLQGLSLCSQINLHYILIHMFILTLPLFKYLKN